MLLRLLSEMVIPEICGSPANTAGLATSDTGYLCFCYATNTSKGTNALLTTDNKH